MKACLKKILSVSLCLLMLACFTFAGIAESSAAELELYNTEKSSRKGNVSLNYGQTIGVRFNAGASFESCGIEINIQASNRVMTGRLYLWKGSVSGSKASGAVAQKKFTSWEKLDVISISAGDAGVSSFQPGEYYYELSMDEGPAFKFTWYSPAVSYSRGYVNGYPGDGSPVTIVRTGASMKDFALRVSMNETADRTQVPPEAVIAEDSAIAQMAVDSTLWTAVDGLGRTVTPYSEAGNKKDRKVGIFYWTWHRSSSTAKPQNLTEVLREYPEAVNNYNHKIWSSLGSFTGWWNEPLWGYYTEMDDYVLRKHAELLADAGVDFVLFDCTNQDLTFEAEYLNLLKVWSQAREDGVKTPQIGFMMPFWDQDYTLSSLKQIFYRIYRPGLYQDLWFYWEGKPLVMGISEMLDESDPELADIKNFFTFRKGVPEYWLEDGTDAEWGWLHVYPQAVYYNADGTPEQTTVGVAQNADYTTMKLSAMNSGHNMGRGYSMDKDFSYTYTYRGKDIVCSSSMENAHYYGINFQEQWNFALKTDPEIVFVTGWNEWTVGRYEEWGGVKNAFPDQCDDANSRDIEPSKGELKDHYYYQLVSNVRKYKGMSVPQSAAAPVTVDINDSGFGAWDGEGVVTYNHYRNNTYERDVDGSKTKHYTNPGIRNDFVTLKAAYDDTNFYFYAETDKPVTPYTDPNWMRLLLDTGAAEGDSRDWEEFEYIVGREAGSAGTLVLERSTGGWNWEKVGDVRYSVNGKVMQLEIPRALIGLEGESFSLSFKWADANIEDGDVMTLYTDGDAAPGGRFAFLFTSVRTERIEDPAVKPGKKGCGGVFGSAGLAACAAGAFAALLLRNSSADSFKYRSKKKLS